jgi:hypothetical protein
MGRPMLRSITGSTCKKKLLPLVSSADSTEISAVLNNRKKIYIDGTEQPIRRPVDPIDQRENYSGKKKKHTSKILLVTNENKGIDVITPVYVGSTHDFSMFKEEALIDVLPSGTPIYLDTGFEGIQKLREDLNIRKPKKKPRNRKLNGGERLGNRLISRERVKVEHSIGGIKMFKIVSSTFRGISQSMNRTFEIICGIWNLKISRKLAAQSV